MKCWFHPEARIEFLESVVYPNRIKQTLADVSLRPLWRLFSGFRLIQICIVLSAGCVDKAAFPDFLSALFIVSRIAGLKLSQ